MTNPDPPSLSASIKATTFSSTPSTPTLPIPIFLLPGSVSRYLIYDSITVSYLRSQHSILGVLIGTLPQIPQQNLFLGLPLELLPEEVHLLVKNGIAYIVDDRARHDANHEEKDFRKATGKERATILEKLRREGEEIAREIESRKKKTKDAALSRQQRQKRGADVDLPEKDLDHSIQKKTEDHSNTEYSTTTTSSDLFAPSTLPPPRTSSRSRPRSRSRSPSHSPNKLVPTYTITPTTTFPPPPAPPPSPSSLPLYLPSHPLNPNLPSPTPPSPQTSLHNHLHTPGYTLTPGLRFGAQFSVYPGDPLRFHSHFLANAYEWDEEFDLIDLIAGGRLGTGVKKGWMIGGVEPGREGEGKGQREKKTEGGGKEEEEGKGEEGDGEREGEGERVRTFCVEWGGM